MDGHAVYMKEALAEAEKAGRRGEVPVGAVVVAPGGEVIARAHNRPVGLNDPTAHAEILALRKAAAVARNYRLPGHHLYVTLEPCLMCAGALVQARVEMVVFGAKDPKAGALESLYRVGGDGRLNHQLQVHGGILAEECRALLRAFFNRRR